MTKSRIQDSNVHIYWISLYSFLRCAIRINEEEEEIKKMQNSFSICHHYNNLLSLSFNILHLNHSHNNNNNHLESLWNYYYYQENRGKKFKLNQTVMNNKKKIIIVAACLMHSFCFFFPFYGTRVLDWPYINGYYYYYHYYTEREVIEAIVIVHCSLFIVHKSFDILSYSVRVCVCVWGMREKKFRIQILLLFAH